METFSFISNPRNGKQLWLLGHGPMKDEDVSVWSKGCASVLNWCCGNNLLCEVLYPFIQNGLIENNEANLNYMLCSEHLTQ